jgi:membrane-associated phospholipid phosphatase
MNATDATRSRLASPTTVRILRWGGPAVWVVAFVIFWLSRGLPLSRDMLVAWILLGLLAFSLTNVRGWMQSVVLEWLPFLAILWVYDLLRGQADDLFFQAHVLPQLRADEFLGAGVAPTVRLQDWLWDGPFTIHWYDYLAWLVYVSYFLATYVVAAVLWFVARDRFRRYVVMVSVTAMMAFATYALFPAVPPWMASELGELEPTTRSIGVIWSHIPIGNFDTLYEKGAAYSNQVAAVPSLHGGYTLLVALILWPLVPRWGRFLLAVYPIAMTYALVYTAEHYVVDILLGWLYALIAYWAVNRLFDRLAERRERREAATAAT